MIEYKVIYNTVLMLFCNTHRPSLSRATQLESFPIVKLDAREAPGYPWGPPNPGGPVPGGAPTGRQPETKPSGERDT